MSGKGGGLAAVVAGVFVMAGLATAHANDSAAELRAGGLFLVRSDVIDMVSEDLFLSTKEVRVRYVYRNTSSTDVTLRVAFPLPDMDEELFEGDVDLPNSDSPNFVDFHTSVDGKEVPLDVEMRAVLDSGLDVTDRVKAAGLPVALLDGRAWDAAQTKIPRALAEQLRDEGLIDWDLRYLSPEWTLKTTFHRMQTFPAGKDVVVEHVYKPVVGIHFYSRDASPEEEAEYCIDANFKAALDKYERSTGYTQYLAHTLGYVLTTGANWAKPIGSFHLTIEKDSPGQFIALCAEGLKKTGPTRFEMTRVDFRPERDIRILMLN